MSWAEALRVEFFFLSALCALALWIGHRRDPAQRAARARRKRLDSYQHAHRICSPQVSRGFMLAMKNRKPSNHRGISV